MLRRSTFVKGIAALVAAMLLIFFMPSTASAMIAKAQAWVSKDAGTVTSTTLAYGSNVTTNDLLVVVSRTGGTTATVTITDTCGNTWTNLTRNSVSGIGVTQVSYAISNCSSADTITDTLSTSTTLRMSIGDFNGTATSSPIDFDSNSATSTGSTVSNTSHTPAVNNELIISFAAFSGGVNGVSGGTSGGTYTVETQVPAAPSTKLAVEDLIQTTATATTGDMTITSDTWMAGMVFVKPPGGTNQNGNVSVTLTESDSVAVTVGRVVSPSVTLTESDSVTANAARSPIVTENLTTIATVTANTALHVGVSESLTTSASVTGTGSGGTSKSVSITENLTTTATVARVGALHVAVVENLNENDSTICTSCLANFVENLTTIATVTAVVNTTNQFSASPTENLTVSPSVTALASHPRALTENLTTTSSVSALAGKQVAVTESLTTIATASTAGVFSRSVAESLSTSAAVSASVTGVSQRGVSEFLTTSATVAVLSARFLGADESHSTVATVSVSAGRSIGFQENLTPSDSVSVSVFRANQRRRVIIIETP